MEDLTGFKSGDVDRKMMKQTQKIYEENLPARIQSILVVDPPARPLVALLLKIARLFMKKKIIDRVQILRKAEVVEFISPDNLSVDFGGELVQSTEEWRQTILV